MEKDEDKTVWLSPLVLDQGFAMQFRDDHVHIELGKDYKVSPEHRQALWNMIGDACEKHGTRRVLVEGTAPEGVFQPSEIIDAGMKTATVPKLWMAFCFADFLPNEQSELFETVSASRGVRVKFFTDPDSALKWLRTNASA